MGDVITDSFNVVVKSAFDARSSHQGVVIKWLLISYSIVLVVNIFILVRKHPNLWDYVVYGTQRPKKREERKRPTVPVSGWESAKGKLGSVNPNDWKVAVIEADKLFDQALINFGAAGNTLGERLKNIVPGDVAGMLDSIWEAHKVRNKIVHDPLFELTNEEARKTVHILEEGSRALSR